MMHSSNPGREAVPHSATLPSQRRRASVCQQQEPRGAERKPSMEQIASLAEARDVDGLETMLAADEQEARVEAAHALGRLRRPRTVPALVSAMGDAQVRVRQAAAQALTRIGEPAVPALVAALEGKGGRLAPYALWALGEIGSPAALDALVRGASDSSGWRVRWSAVKSLGDVGGEKAIQALVGALGDRDQRVRSMASERLQRIGEPAVKPLAYLLRHSNRDMRSEARKTLVGIGTPAALVALQREQLLMWIPVGVMVIGLLLVILWLGSMIVS